MEDEAADDCEKACEAPRIRRNEAHRMLRGWEEIAMMMVSVSAG